MTPTNPPITFEADALIPAVIQDAATGDVLMVGFMNEEALAATRRTGKVHFWSRSRRQLWRKGETSGHEQLVDEILVNCELNSLLVKVRQIGAACHEGYQSCYYRRLETDGSLTTIRERIFDPADVYGPQPHDLAAQTRLWFGAYEYLRDHDLTADSRTSRLLRSGDNAPHRRIGEELNELSGVLDGSHAHTNLAADIILEGSQVLYWIAVNAIRQQSTWDDLRPDRALATNAPDLPPASAARLLRAEAAYWTAGKAQEPIAAPRYHAAIALVAQASRSANIDPARLIETDLEDLRRKPYLRRYFDTAPHPAGS